MGASDWHDPYYGLRETYHDLEVDAAEQRAAANLCIFCRRPFGDHGWDQRHICNLFIGATDERRVIGMVLPPGYSDAADFAKDCGIEVVEESVRGAATNWQMLESLRAPEGASVEFVCDNPDFGPGANSYILVTDRWTDWKPRRFEGDNVAACLTEALKARAVFVTPMVSAKP